MPDAEPTVMELLRDSTRDLHDDAENHAFQRALAKGELPQEEFVRYLGQMLLVHRALEDRLRAARENSPAIAAVVNDEQFQVPYLLEDLAHFGTNPDSIEPLPATARVIETINEHAGSPLFLLGMHYVLEGSNNGSRFIARNIARTYRLEPGPGLRYLDPYGASQREVWSAFKDDMNRVGFSRAESQTLVEAAGVMFTGIADISTDLLEPVAA